MNYTRHELNIQSAKDKLARLEDALASEFDPTCQAILEDDIKEAKASLWELTD